MTRNEVKRASPLVENLPFGRRLKLRIESHSLMPGSCK